MPSPTHPPTDTGAIGAERSVLAALLARVEAASGPDRELEKALWYRLIFDAALAKHDDSYLALIGSPYPRYTASLDAALALCERVLPDAYFGVQQNRWGEGDSNDRSWSAYVNTFTGDQNTDDDYEFTSRKASPAVALLAAMLRALLAQAPSPVTAPTGVLETFLIVEGSSGAESARTGP